MSGWDGAWIALALGFGFDVWAMLKRKELEQKYPKIKWKWYEKF